jgi:hypothetical protein
MLMVVCSTPLIILIFLFIYNIGSIKILFPTSCGCYAQIGTLQKKTVDICTQMKGHEDEPQAGTELDYDLEVIDLEDYNPPHTKPRHFAVPEVPIAKLQQQPNVTSPKKRTINEPQLPTKRIRIMQSTILESEFTCDQIVRGMGDWDKLRSCLLDNAVFVTYENRVQKYIVEEVARLKPDVITDFLLELCKYRELYINDILRQIMTIFEGRLLIENEAGSRDPESDYDVTVASNDGTLCDVEAIQMFNDFFVECWGKPSGIIFDTNLYPRAFVIVEPKFEVGHVALFLDKPPRTPRTFFSDVHDYKQNMFAFITVRKYMLGNEWHSFISMMLSNFDGTHYNQMLSFFHKADRTYCKYMKEFLATIPPGCADFNIKVNNALKLVLSEAPQEVINFEEIMHGIKNRYPVEIMQHSNNLFMEVYAEARTLENKIRAIEDLYDRSFLFPILRMPHWHVKQIDAMSVQMRHKISKSHFFANDACLSEGCRFHCGVEQYHNAIDKSYERDQIMMVNNVSNNQLWQSINENFGNMMKDIKHYIEQNAVAGRVIYRSGKYLYRALTAAAELGSRKITRMGFEGKDPDTQGPSDLKKLVQQLLLPIRKMKPPFDKLNPHGRANMAVTISEIIFATEERLKRYWEQRRGTLPSSSDLYARRRCSWDELTSSKRQKRKLSASVKSQLVSDIKLEIDSISSTGTQDWTGPTDTSSWAHRRKSLPQQVLSISLTPDTPTQQGRRKSIEQERPLSRDKDSMWKTQVTIDSPRITVRRPTDASKKFPPHINLFLKPAENGSPTSRLGVRSPRAGVSPRTPIADSPRSPDASETSSTVTPFSAEDADSALLMSSFKSNTSEAEPITIFSGFDPNDKYAVVDELASSVRNSVLFYNSQITTRRVQGVFDYIPEWLRFITDMNPRQYGIIVDIDRSSYHAAKKREMPKRLAIGDYCVGIIFGIISLLVQIIIAAPITFALRPIREMYNIGLRLLYLHAPQNRRFVQLRAAWHTMETGELIVPHEQRVIDTRVTLQDAYGIPFGLKGIAFARYLNIIAVDLMIWFSWIVLMLTILGAVGVPYLWNYVYIFRNCSLGFSFVAFIICTVLNTWTTLRRFYLRNSKDVRYYAAARENQFTRSNYVAMSSYLCLSVIIGAVIAAWDGASPIQYIYIIPFSKFFLFDSINYTALQIVRFIITQGFVNVFIGRIAMRLGGEGQLPDRELSRRDHIDWKEWLNMPFGMLCSIIKLIERV